MDSGKGWLFKESSDDVLYFDYVNLFSKKIATITNPKIPNTPVGLGPISVLIPGVATSAGHSPITLIEPCKTLAGITLFVFIVTYDNHTPSTIHTKVIIKIPEYGKNQ